MADRVPVLVGIGAFGLAAALGLGWWVWPSTDVEQVVDDTPLIDRGVPRKLTPLPSGEVELKDAEIARLRERVQQLEEAQEERKTRLLELPEGRRVVHQLPGGGSWAGAEEGTLPPEATEEILDLVGETLAKLDLGDIDCSNGNCVVLDEQGNPRDDVQVMMHATSASDLGITLDDLPEGVEGRTMMMITTEEGEEGEEE